MKETLVKQGRIAGVEKDGYTLFRGIPYAQPPVGDLRWRAPREPQSWNGVYQADKWPSRSMQDAHADNFYDKEFYDEPEYMTPVSEDSLYMNIWTPAKGPEEKLPVAFYIHGGAFMGGFGHEKEFDGAACCKRGVILVTINYRLGPIGFLAHPWLSQESENNGGPAVSGNYGILDQIAALKWVRENIEAFGGDPDNITVFGQSAGCMSVQTLVSSPLTKGMIAKAVLQSGTGLSYDHTLSKAEQEGVEFAANAGVSSLEEMRALSFEQIMAAAGPVIAKGFPTMELAYTPVIDGMVLEDGYNAAMEQGKVHNIPYMVGSTKNDIATDLNEIAKGNPGKVYEGRIEAMNEKMMDLQERLGDIVSQETIEKLGAMIPDSVSPASVVPIIAGIVKRLPAGLSADEVVAEVGKQMKNKADDNKAQAQNKAGSVRAITRQYYDSLLIEMRLMGAQEPSTEMEFFGHTFASPIMTGAMSHMSLYRKGVYGPMEFLAQGAAAANCVHWVGMTDNDHFAQIMETGAKVVRGVKPYADEEKIFSQIQQAEELGCIAIDMDIDHVLTSLGENDIAMGEELEQKTLEQKTLEQMRSYAEATRLPFIVKGVLSVHDALRCKEIGADGIMISHHGGRLTYLVPPLAVLPKIKEAVGDSVKIFVDCGICSGMDAYKAMALGADAVGCGSHLAGIARTKGAEAVEKRMREMTAELKGAMYFTGVKDCASFDPTVIHMRAF